VIAGHGSPIAEKGPLAIAALVVHGSRAKAAEAAGVHPDTIKRWLGDADFRAAYEEAQRQQADETMQALKGAMLGSVQVLVAFRDDPTKSDALRRQCAYDILTLGKAAMEGAELAERLGKLEAMQELLRHELTY